MSNYFTHTKIKPDAFRRVLAEYASMKAIQDCGPAKVSSNNLHQLEIPKVVRKRLPIEFKDNAFAAINHLMATDPVVQHIIKIQLTMPRPPGAVKELMEKVLLLPQRLLSKLTKIELDYSGPQRQFAKTHCCLKTDYRPDRVVNFFLARGRLELTEDTGTLRRGQKPKFRVATPEDLQNSTLTAEDFLKRVDEKAWWLLANAMAGKKDDTENLRKLLRYEWAAQQWNEKAPFN